MAEKTLSLKEAAEYLKIDLQTFYELARNRKIPCVKLGGQWRFSKEDLDLIRENLMEVIESSVEHRRLPRFDSINLISYTSLGRALEGDQGAMARTLDISLTGIKMETTQSFAPGTMLSIEVAVDENVLEIEGRVIRVTQLGSKNYEVGLEITNILDQDKEILTKYLAEREVPPQG